MKIWSKHEALDNLMALSKDVERISSTQAFSTEHTIWTMKCLEIFEEVFGITSRYYLTFASLTWRNSGTTLIERDDYQAEIDAWHRKAFLEQLGIAKGLLLSAIDYLEKREIADVYSVKNSEPEANVIMNVFNLVEHQLRKAMRVSPTKEKEVQDALENLLIGANISFKRETDRIEYSSKTYTPDFSFPQVNLIVETKLCNHSDREKEIIAEINDDILAYQTKYRNLCFVVYDNGGFIRDTDKFTDSFSNSNNVNVRVVKH